MLLHVWYHRLTLVTQFIDIYLDLHIKLVRKLSENPSQLARPNVIVIFQMEEDLLSSEANLGKFIRAVIAFKDLEVSAWSRKVQKYTTKDKKSYDIEGRSNYMKFFSWTTH